MGRHAYCILAHSEPELFCRLVHALDDPRNDIFVHIDRKSDIRPFLLAQCMRSRLVFLPDRISCNWATISIVQAEFRLLRTARTAGPYQCYHILSGVDFPLQSQDTIHQYVDGSPQTNFIGICPQKSTTDLIARRTQCYHFFIRRPGGSLSDRLIARIGKWLVLLQERMGIRRSFPYALRKGAQWMSLSDDFCAYLLEKEQETLALFKYTLCPDEIAIHSVFFASPYAATQHAPEGEEYEQCMREIDWVRGSPYTWQETDYEILAHSKRWFARKFSSKQSVLTERLLVHITNS